MIDINFIGNDIAREKFLWMKRLFLSVYCLAWVLSLFAIFVQYRTNKIERTRYAKSYHGLKLKLEKDAPRFEQAIQLFVEKNQAVRTLRNQIGAAVSAEFVLRSLEIVLAKIDESVWLSEVAFSIPTNNTESDELEEEPESENVPFSLLIKGNIILDLNNKNSDQLHNLVNQIKGESPFSMAQSRLDLADMKIKKLNEKYYHNFTIEFLWSDAIL